MGDARETQATIMRTDYHLQNLKNGRTNKKYEYDCCSIIFIVVNKQFEFQTITYNC